MVVFAQAEMHERTMPPEVVAEIVACVPMRFESLEPGDSVLVAVARFHHMGDRVHGPRIAAIRIDRLAPLALGRLELTVLFETECVETLHEAVTGNGARPRV